MWETLCVHDTSCCFLLPAFDQKQVFGELAIKVAKDNALIGQLERSFISEERDQFTIALHGLLLDECQKVVKDP